MNYSNNIKSLFEEKKTFDIKHEARMVQARLISPILDEIECKELKQEDLAELTGLSQPFLSSLFNNKRNLSMEHIAKLQHALDIILQSPKAVSIKEHDRKYYNGEERERRYYINSQLHPISFNEDSIEYNIKKHSFNL